MPAALKNITPLPQHGDKSSANSQVLIPKIKREGRIPRVGAWDQCVLREL
jgi:hypothetical protein